MIKILLYFNKLNVALMNSLKNIKNVFIYILLKQGELILILSHKKKRKEKNINKNEYEVWTCLFQFVKNAVSQ